MTLSIRQTGFTAIGECMIELHDARNTSEETFVSVGYGGDTLNTALYLSRLGVPSGFATMLGDDPRSQCMIEQWRAEGIDTSDVIQVPGRQPGLYWITTDDHGERSFAYWRSEAPARELFDDPVKVRSLTASLMQKGVVYLSGITLSLYSDTGFERLLSMLSVLRGHGVVVVFDGNYRPRGWVSRDMAAEAFEEVARLSDIVLPTFEDEAALFGDVDPQATISRLHSWGVTELVVKLGAAGCVVVEDGTQTLCAPQLVRKPVDTTAAGDSFNAGYLAGRYRGMSPAASAEVGNALAGEVIMHRGAIIPTENLSPLIAQLSPIV